MTRILRMLLTYIFTAHFGEIDGERLGIIYDSGRETSQQDAFQYIRELIDREYEKNKKSQSPIKSQQQQRSPKRNYNYFFIDWDSNQQQSHPHSRPNIVYRKLIRCLKNVKQISSEINARKEEQAINDDDSWLGRKVYKDLT